METLNPVTVIALLPMKANSERVEGKNFRDFCGKPLFRWILDTLLGIQEIDRILINTDAREILANHGITDTARITIRDRKPELCGDFVSMNAVISDDIANVGADVYLMTHVTNPFLTASTIQSALNAYREAVSLQKADSLFTVDRVQTRFYRADGTPINHDPNELIRTQDLEPWFEENSNLYIFSAQSFLATQARIGLKPLLFEGPRNESVDIDNPADWDFAVIKAKHLGLT
jgi:CMP-N-acetylneuraminic acid synthetase